MKFWNFLNIKNDPRDMLNNFGFMSRLKSLFIAGQENFQNFMSAGISMENFISNFSNLFRPYPPINPFAPENVDLRTFFIQKMSPNFRKT